jgi:predicted SAM-dependent methyltransferase
MENINTMLNKVLTILKQEGIHSLIRKILSRFYTKKAHCYPLIKTIVSTGHGLEIGGISPVFQKKSILPVYPYIQALDNCNFSGTTVWEGNIDEGETYHYSEVHRPGRQYVLEATDLKSIETESYDFLLSSHMIEHTANPIKALKEWMRVVKTNGYLVLLIPHKDGTFDHNRPVTKLEHLVADYENGTTEEDLTHMDEILELHDLSMDLEAGTHLQFAERSKKNYENRGLHHHVFNSRLAVDLMDYLQLKIKAVEAIAPMHILIVVQKTLTDDKPDNSAFIRLVNSPNYNTPFPSDKI